MRIEKNISKIIFSSDKGIPFSVKLIHFFLFTDLFRELVWEEETRIFLEFSENTFLRCLKIALTKVNCFIKSLIKIN